MLAPGGYIDSHWGHYQGQKIIELAQALHWPDPLPHATSLMQSVYPDLDEMQQDAWQETVDEAEAYINEHHVPEGYWFGHHPDIGDVGVWELEDD